MFHSSHAVHFSHCTFALQHCRSRDLLNASITLTRPSPNHQIHWLAILEHSKITCSISHPLSVWLQITSSITIYSIFHSDPPLYFMPHVSNHKNFETMLFVIVHSKNESSLKQHKQNEASHKPEWMTNHLGEKGKMNDVGGVPRPWPFAGFDLGLAGPV